MLAVFVTMTILQSSLAASATFRFLQEETLVPNELLRRILSSHAEERHKRYADARNVDNPAQPPSVPCRPNDQGFYGSADGIRLVVDFDYVMFVTDEFLNKTEVALTSLEDAIVNRLLPTLDADTCDGSRRSLRSRRLSEVVGVSATPEDSVEGACDPEVGENCFFIKGAMYVFVSDNDSEVVDGTREKIRDSMNSGDFDEDGNHAVPGITLVRFIDPIATPVQEEDETAQSNGSSGLTAPTYAIVAGAAALVIAAIIVLVTRRRRDDEDEDAEPNSEAVDEADRKKDISHDDIQLSGSLAPTADNTIDQSYSTDFSTESSLGTSSEDSLQPHSASGRATFPGPLLGAHREEDDDIDDDDVLFASHDLVSNIDDKDASRRTDHAVIATSGDDEDEDDDAIHTYDEKSE